MGVKRELDQGPCSATSTPSKKRGPVIFLAARRMRLSSCSNPSTESSTTSPDGHCPEAIQRKISSAENAYDLTLVGPTTFSAPLDKNGIKSPGPTLPKTPLPETTLPLNTPLPKTSPLDVMPPSDCAGAAAALSLEEPSPNEFTADGTASQVACPVQQSSWCRYSSRQPDAKLWNMYKDAIRGSLWRIGVYQADEEDPSHQVVGYEDPTDQEWESLRDFISHAPCWSLASESPPTHEKDHPASHMGLIAYVPVPTSIQSVWRQILCKQHSWSFSNPSFSNPSISESMKLVGELSDKQWPPGVISLFSKGSVMHSMR